MPGTRDDNWMGIIGLIGKLFGIDAAAPPDAAKLDATTEAALARSLSALPAGERGWLTLSEARTLFSTEGAEYAFGEMDQTAEETSSRSRRGTEPPSTLCPSRSGFIS